jgi:Na+/H+-dicarboxylate symporter
MGMVAGLCLGLVMKSFGPWTFLSDLVEVVGRIFIASLNLLVVPLVFVSLVCGSASIDDIKRLGRVGAKTFSLYLITTALAVAVAIFLSVIFQPGSGFDLSISASAAPSLKDSPPLKEVVVGLFPSNPIRAMAEGNMLQIIVFALLLGVAMTSAGHSGKKVLETFTHLNEVIMRLVFILMGLAPFGVFCLIAKVFSEQGFAALAPLAKYFSVVMLALSLHLAGVYSVLLKLLGGLSPMLFAKKFKRVCLFAFSTSSSNATIPVNLETVEHRLGVSNSIASFTIPLGATVNMDGTAIMQGVATVFISQAYGMDIGFRGYLIVILTATLASIGTAGVPGVGLITLAMVLKQVGLPVEGIGLIIGVDRLLDMWRTVVNVSGDAVVTCIVAKSEKQIDLKIYNSKI